MKLHYRSAGNGEPLIILHGLFGSLDNWYTISKKLSESFTVYAVDQRNHGRSPHSDSHTYDDLVDDLRAFMKDHDIGRANLLGHSMGGTAAMHFALQYPDAAERLIVVDIAPRKYPPKHDTIFDALDGIDPAEYSKRSGIDEALSRTLPDEQVRMFIMKNITRDKSDRFVWKMNLDAIRKNYDTIIGGPGFNGSYGKPTLFIKGARSGYIADEDESVITELFPNSTLRTIPDAGHWVHAEAPELFIEAVREFLEA
jgi:esterase